MAGGKETPRQKMIGMMYLVLTALLALNVSKSILDAFVAIEENTQKANIVQYDRGTGFYNDVKSELSGAKGEDQKAKRAKLEYVLKRMELVDKESSKMIESIDNLKKKILEKSGEDVSGFKNKDGSTILWSKYDKKKGSLPTRMNLMAVQAKDQYDVPMRVIIGEEITGPTGEGLKLWEDFNKYRNKVVELTGTYEWGGKQFTVKPVNIPLFANNEDLSEQVAKMIDKSKGNLKEDRQVLIDLYMGMTKLEKRAVNGVNDVHWIGSTFDHAPLVAAIASLSSMQQDVLATRALSMAHWKSKVSTGNYSFNKIIPLAYGPSVANNNEEIELQVMMAAFDSDNQPVVTVDGYDNQDMVSYPGNGQGIVKMTTGSGQMTLTGTVSIKNKSGVKKTEKWEKTVIIMKPQGAIEMPEFNILYRGYDNKVEATASGYDKTILSASGASVSGSGPYIVKPTGRGRDAYLTVSGKNTATGKTASLKKVKYRVLRLPNPEIFWGNAMSGDKADKRAPRLFAKYPPEIPLKANWRIVDWSVQVPGAEGRPPSGTGSNISSATRMIANAKKGQQVVFTCGVIGPDGVKRKRAGSFTIK